MTQNTFHINYRFTLPDRTTERFDLEIDSETLELIHPPSENLPHWSRLDFHQCPHCPLDIEEHPECPLAVNLVEMLNASQRLISHDQVRVDVMVRDRLISQKTSAQRGISSLMGLLIATSGCPWTSFFKPMARFHLPFADEEETIWRAASTYLLAQYFLGSDDPCFDMELKGMSSIYRNIETLNITVIQRLRAASRTDSAINALIRLDIFAKYLSPDMEESLASIRRIFRPFLTKYLERKAGDRCPF
ncbi:MAG: DUF6901 family protein [Desulfobacterales bacterium]